MKRNEDKQWGGDGSSGYFCRSGGGVGWCVKKKPRSRSLRYMNSSPDLATWQLCDKALSLGLSIYEMDIVTAPSPGSWEDGCNVWRFPEYTIDSTSILATGPFVNNLKEEAYRSKWLICPSSEGLKSRGVDIPTF